MYKNTIKLQEINQEGQKMYQKKLFLLNSDYHDYHDQNSSSNPEQNYF